MDQMRELLQLFLLGGLQINLAGQSIINFLSAKAQALLCYLTVTGQPHSRERLAGLLWGNMAESEAKANLRQVLANLRKQLAVYMDISRETVSLNQDSPYSLDVQLFEAALSPQHGQGLSISEALIVRREAPGKSLEVPLEAVRQAVELYRGEFLEGFMVREALAFEEWLSGQRERLRQLALHGLHRLAVEHTARGEFAAGLHYTTRLLALEPWREESQRQMMILLVKSGQRSAALAQYESCRRILAEELGVEPAAETVALYQRLKTMGATRPHNLPPQTSAFVGREAELARIADYLESPGCRLLTLAGLGGIGKTRLALQAAMQRGPGPTFADGIFLIPLAVLAYPKEEWKYGSVEGWKIGRMEEWKIGRMEDRVSDKENRFTFQPSNLPSNLPTLTALLLSLFSRRSGCKLILGCRRRTRPRWCGCAGWSMGCPWRLNWPPLLSCAEIVAEIERDLDFLATSLRNTPERHRSIRAVLDASWDLLLPAEQKVLKWLTIFQGGFSREVAGQVADASFPLLLKLLNKSLLRRDASGRYSMHELVRQYCAEKLALSPLEQAEAAQRHDRYYAEFMDG